MRDGWTCDGSCEYGVGEAGCMISTAINYDLVKNYSFDYCKSPDGLYVSETQCRTNEDCISII